MPHPCARCCPPAAHTHIRQPDAPARLCALDTHAKVLFIFSRSTCSRCAHMPSSNTEVVTLKHEPRLFHPNACGCIEHCVSMPPARTQACLPLAACARTCVLAKGMIDDIMCSTTCCMCYRTCVVAKGMIDDIMCCGLHPSGTIVAVGLHEKLQLFSIAQVTLSPPA